MLSSSVAGASAAFSNKEHPESKIKSSHQCQSKESEDASAFNVATSNVLPINTAEVQKITKILEKRSQKIVASEVLAKRIDEYRSKYTLRKQKDLECVLGIGPETAKLFTSLFQRNCCDNDDPLKHLPPHVRHIVDENQAEFNKDPIANRLLIVHLSINGLKKKINSLKKFT